MRRNPFEELEDFFERMEDQFDGRVGFESGPVAVDVADTETEYVVIADLPGFTAEDIELTFADGRLGITGSRDEETISESDEDDIRYLRQERRQESVDRTVRIPDPIEEAEIQASFTDGVLTVTLPKAEPDQGTRIEIE